MTEITYEKITGKLNLIGHETFNLAMRQAQAEGNRHVELVHWLFQLLSNDRSDFSVIVDHYGFDRGAQLARLMDRINKLKRNITEMPSFSAEIYGVLNDGWRYASLLFGDTQIRSGHILFAMLCEPALQQVLRSFDEGLGRLSSDTLFRESQVVWSSSGEERMQALAPAAPQSQGGGAERARGSGALARFSIDMTAQAESGKTDPVVGRDDEIRQLIDVLMRRRQNNPILTGEAGVGKTAVVEGFAQVLANGDVPPLLKGTRLHALDIGLMQAGASMKGEFEQRLRSVIDEVQASPTPIILFIDEAHTLIGAGGPAGTGDAANLLKPALARGTLRTIGATTWSEYRQHFEKDPALTRRFQPINVDEPSIGVACTMLRGILGPMEAHHRVRISDEAVVAAVTLSARYLPARQLPDKAVSLLDTAAARVAISQSATPAMITDIKAEIRALETEREAIQAEAELGGVDAERLEDIAKTLTERREALDTAESEYHRERLLVDEIVAMRGRLAEGADDQKGAVHLDALRAELGDKVRSLTSTDPDRRMVYAHVDEQSVASVVSDWTGIPVGRMVTDELRAVLALPDRLRERVIGQDHGLVQIAKRIETNRAKLDNPGKPIGVFMLCGPSGVGKTETALALAEAIYGGEQNVITINMSEFQEAHTVSALKGAPPGYVGYGEGGRLTEAVRRKPYSVVLLDEIEKAHPDVHQLFFQVFDKGVLEDGTGRRIDFKNTVILLTSNVGTEVIMDMAERGETRPEPEVLAEALRPHLQQVFPPALLGRIVTIPYFPLSPDVLAGIVKLKLDAIVRRMKSAHGASMTYEDAVVEHIVSQCHDPDSGGRMIDNIITNTILPDLSRSVLTRMLEGTEFRSVVVTLSEEGFAYAFD